MPWCCQHWCSFPPWFGWNAPYWGKGPLNVTDLSESSHDVAPKQDQGGSVHRLEHISPPPRRAERSCSAQQLLNCPLDHGSSHPPTPDSHRAQNCFSFQMHPQAKAERSPASSNLSAGMSGAHRKVTYRELHVRARYRQ